MGIEIANALYNAGADVTLVCGPVKYDVNRRIKRIDVMTAQQMLEECSKMFVDSDIWVMSAAVADYKPDSVVPHKIKKSDSNLTLNLVKNPDILSTLASVKKTSQFVVGFALETDNFIENALSKLKNKNLDMIVLNKPGKDTGFATLTNQVVIINKDKSIKELPLKSKKEVAIDIVDEIIYSINK